MVLDPARKPSAAFPAELLGGDDPWPPAAAAEGPEADSPRAPPWVPATAARHEAPRREALAPLAEHPGSDRRVSWSPGAADVESENEDDVAWSCVEINQCVDRCTRKFFTKSFLGDDAAVLVRSSGEEPASPRHRAGVASMAWRTTRRFSTNAP